MGVIAALLIAFLPMAGILAVTMSDNIPMMFFATLSMFALLRASRSHSKEWYLASGITLVLVPLTTPEGFIMWVIAALFVAEELFRGRQKLDGKMLCLPLGFAIALAGLMLFNYLNVGNPLVTFQATSQFYSALGQPGTIPYADTSSLFYPKVMFYYNPLYILASDAEKLNFNPLSVWGQIQYYYNSPSLPFNSQFYFYAFVLAVAYLAARRDSRTLFAMWWFLLGFLYLEFGPMHVSISPLAYQLSHRLDRFLLIIAVPTCVVIAAALERFARNSKGKPIYPRAAVACIVVIFLLATSIPVLQFWHSVISFESYPQSSIAHYLNAEPNTTRIFLDGEYDDLLVYMHFQNMGRFNLSYSGSNSSGCPEIPVGSFVLVPKYPQFNPLYAPNTSLCNGWELVLDPSQDENVSSAAYNVSEPFQTELYRVTNLTGLYPTGHRCGYEIRGDNGTYVLDSTCDAFLVLAQNASDNRITCNSSVAAFAAITFQNDTYNNTIANCTFDNASIESMHLALNNILSPKGSYGMNFTDNTSNIALGYYFTFVPKDMSGNASEERFAAVAPYALVLADPHLKVFDNQFVTRQQVEQFADSMNYALPRFGEHLPVNSSENVSFALESEQISEAGTREFNPYLFTVPYWGYDILSYREFNITSDEEYTPLFISPEIQEDTQFPDNTTMFWNFTVRNYGGARNITARLFNGYQFEPPTLAETINDLQPGGISHYVGRQEPGVYAFMGELQARYNGTFEQSNSTTTTYGVGLAFCTQGPLARPGSDKHARILLHALPYSGRAEHLPPNKPGLRRCAGYTIQQRNHKLQRGHNKFNEFQRDHSQF